MHILFKLPTGSGGQAAAYVNTLLDRELAAWSRRWGVCYTKRLEHFQAVIEFSQERDYSMFAMTWELDRPEWRICD